MTKANDIFNPEEVDELKKVCVSPDSISPHCCTPTLPLLVQEHTNSIISRRRAPEKTR